MTLFRSDNIKSALRDMKITGLTKMQFDFLSKLSNDAKKFVLSTTPGAGKTIAYAMKILSHVDREKKYPQVLCLCSTYEAAKQTLSVLMQIANGSGIEIGSAVQEGTGLYCLNIIFPSIFKPNEKCNNSTKLLFISVELGKKLTSQVLVGTPKEMVSFKIMRLFNIEKVTLCVIDDADTIITSRLVKDQIVRALDKSCRILIVQSGLSTTYLNFIAPYDIHVDTCPLNVEQFLVDCPSNVEKMKFALLVSKELARLNMQGFIFVEVSLIYCHIIEEYGFNFTE